MQQSLKQESQPSVVSDLTLNCVKFAHGAKLARKSGNRMGCILLAWWPFAILCKDGGGLCLQDGGYVGEDDGKAQLSPSSIIYQQLFNTTVIAADK